MYILAGFPEDDPESETEMARTDEDVERGTNPWQTDWYEVVDGDNGPQILVTLEGAGEPEEGSNTFGLPAESVALIEANYGSVANFLRLRNQGQV